MNGEDGITLEMVAAACENAGIGFAAFRPPGCPGVADPRRLALVFSDQGVAAVASAAMGGTPSAAELLRRLRQREERLELPDYQAYFAALPEPLRRAVAEHRGPAERDPGFVPGEVSCGGFPLMAFRSGRLAVGLEPAIDDPRLPPSHHRLALYGWFALAVRAERVVRLKDDRENWTSPFGSDHAPIRWEPGRR